jgi:hypothetical protein
MKELPDVWDEFIRWVSQLRSLAVNGSKDASTIYITIKVVDLVEHFVEKNRCEQFREKLLERCRELDDWRFGEVHGIRSVNWAC